ncbi:hypothetical protein FOA52_015465 [Chlamydomonas sp. UWO 241]|nr:hypothetical protein FOA52_015465 [Chlamydomonas sp. UWO 241]
MHAASWPPAPAHCELPSPTAGTLALAAPEDDAAVATASSAAVIDLESRSGNARPIDFTTSHGVAPTTRLPLRPLCGTYLGPCGSGGNGREWGRGSIRMAAIQETVHARVGLLGNPSDGYNGCCCSFSLSNFSATVTCTPSSSLVFVPHPVGDSTEFSSLSQLKHKLDTQGFYGGVRLMQATAKVFFEWCERTGTHLPSSSNFTLSYNSDIPRQAGLSGSSAICAATLACLLRFYGLGDRVPLQERPGVVLAAEAALGITAGLQDRVIQVYGGLVAMDFESAHMAAHGHGRYERLDTALLSPARLQGGSLHVLYADNPSDSGRVHADVRARWLAGDPVTRACMEGVAQCARDGRVALERGDAAELARLIDQNFDLRRRMFGDEALGAENLAMVALARSEGCAAKFTGSGGAALVFCPQGQAQAARLASLAEPRGWVLVRAHVGKQR